MVVSHHLRRSKVNEEKVELMYRQPGAETHQNITDVLDEIIITLRDLSNRVSKLEDKD